MAKQVTISDLTETNIGGNTNFVPDEVIVSSEMGDEQAATTVFVDDAAVVKRDESFFARPSRDLYSTSDTQAMEQSLKTFLAKPITIQTGEFKTADVLTTITNIIAPGGIFSAAPAAVWRNKLSGYFGIRMTMNFRIVVNANRFQQGRYIMSYVPFGGAAYSGTKTVAINSNIRLPTLVQRTTVPHVELDLNCDTAAEMSIPYTSVKTFYPIFEALNNPAGIFSVLGTLNVYPYEPLVAVSGSLTAPYRIYCWLTDVELVGAASPQSGLPRTEVNNRQNGVISGPLSAISRGFKEFEGVPLLSSYAHSVSWISDRMAKTAAIFGLSKPNQGDSLLKVNPLSAPSHTTIDGDSDARSLAFVSQPGVNAVAGLSGNQYDEMDFSYIAQKFAWYQSTPWTTATVVDTLLTSIPVGVNKFLQSGSTKSFVPAAYIANHFKLWRGSLKFRFKFVRTEFHSGRLSFDFFPNLPGTTLVANPEYVNRVIVDIREHSEIEIVIPYTANAQFLDFDQAFGFLRITVIDPLVAPATVSGTIKILCEMAAGPDFEVAIPYETYTPTNIVPQSGMSECVIYSTTLGTSEITANPILSSSVAIGDKVSSFRSLVKRFTPIRFSVGNDPGKNAWENLTLSVVTDFLPVKISDVTALYIEADLYASVASCYAIIGGGVRLRDVVSNNRLTKNDSPTAINLSENSSGIMVNGAALVLGISSIAPTVIQEGQHNGIYTVEVPQYSQFVGKTTSDLMAGAGAVYVYNSGSGNATGSNLNVIFTLPANAAPIIATTSNATLHTVYRSGADDTNFYCFVSVPPMTPNIYSAGWPTGYA